MQRIASSADSNPAHKLNQRWLFYSSFSLPVHFIANSSPTPGYKIFLRFKERPQWICDPQVRKVERTSWIFFDPVISSR